MAAGGTFAATDIRGYHTSQSAAARVFGARWHVHINPAINSLYSFGSDLEGSCFSSGSSPGLYNSYCWNAVFCSCSQHTGEYLTGTPRTFTDTSVARIIRVEAVCASKPKRLHNSGVQLPSANCTPAFPVGDPHELI